MTTKTIIITIKSHDRTKELAIFFYTDPMVWVARVRTMTRLIYRQYTIRSKNSEKIEILKKIKYYVLFVISVKVTQRIYQ